MTDKAPSTEPSSTPAAKDEPKDHSAWGRDLKIGAFPLAGGAAYWTMDTAAREHIMDTELKDSKKLGKRFAEYTVKRGELSNAVERGLKKPLEALAEREINHASWRKYLYDHLKEKGFTNFLTKMKHLRRVDQQKIMVEGITVAGIVIGAIYAVTNSEFFSKRKDKDDCHPR